MSAPTPEQIPQKARQAAGERELGKTSGRVGVSELQIISNCLPSVTLPSRNVFQTWLFSGSICTGPSGASMLWLLNACRMVGASSLPAASTAFAHR